MRSFAKDLNISPQHLSAFFSHRRGLSEAKAEEIASRLELDQKTKDLFVSAIRARYTRSPILKKEARANHETIKSEHWSNSEISHDAFQVISDWHHYGLLELIKITPRNLQKFSYFSKRLKISENEVQMALHRLIRLNLVSAQKDKLGWTATHDTVTTSSATPSDAIRKFHVQILKKALDAVQYQSVDERALKSSLMGIRKSKIPLAKKLIQDFKDEFTKKVVGKGGTDVYALSIQFFNLCD